jgi:hypothetical protein
MEEIRSRVEVDAMEAAGQVHFPAWRFWAGSMADLRGQAQAYRTNHPSACIPPGRFILRLNTTLLHLVRQPGNFAPHEDGLAGLMRAAVDLAEYCYKEIPIHAARESADLLAVVDRIFHFAVGYLEAETPPTAREAALGCARSLEQYGQVLMTKYGDAANVADTQLRILRTWMLAKLTRPIQSTPTEEGRKTERDFKPLALPSPRW